FPEELAAKPRPPQPIGVLFDLQREHTERAARKLKRKCQRRIRRLARRPIILAEPNPTARLLRSNVFKTNAKSLLRMNTARVDQTPTFFMHVQIIPKLQRSALPVSASQNQRPPQANRKRRNSRIHAFPGRNIDRKCYVLT